MDAGIVQLLMTWYESQKFHVLWGSSLSEGFTVTNGVRQGGILSPYLFNVYTDDIGVETLFKLGGAKILIRRLSFFPNGRHITTFLRRT